jgi:hypothetical protein
MSSSRPHAPLSDSQSPLSGSKLRKLLPAPGSNHETTSSDSSQGPSLQPRLLPRANITKIACEPCRKRKAKVRVKLDLFILLARHWTGSAR